MKIAAVSDIHGMIKSIKFPEADILVMAGDLLPNFHRSAERDAKFQLEYLSEFDAHLGTLPYKKIFVVPGNHDWCFQVYKDVSGKIKNGVVLIDQASEFQGVKLYGSPWQSWFYDWAFNFPKYDSLTGYPVAKSTWGKIPDDTNILIVHGPPLNILDECDDGRRVGCPILSDTVRTLKSLKLGVFGHIHHSYGQLDIDGVKYVNACACTEEYKPTNPVQVIEI